MKQNVTLRDVEIPEGYEATGEFRPPNCGEPFINNISKLDVARSDWSFCRQIILRPLPTKNFRLRQVFSGHFDYAGDGTNNPLRVLAGKTETVEQWKKLLNNSELTEFFVLEPITE